MVALIARVLAAHQLNIIAMREFVDEAAARFFARIECSGVLADDEQLRQELLAQLPGDTTVTVNPPQPKRIAVLATREYHCLGDILVSHFFRTLDAEVACVISNHDDLRAFTEGFSRPFHHVPHEDRSREQFEAALLEKLSDYSPDYIILAKFMRILSPEFIARYPQRILNIHHSFLPAFAGARPYRQAFERGVKLIGATAHFVTHELDEGPIITQQTIAVNHTFTAARMVEAGREVEKNVLNKAMRLVFRDQVFISGNKTIVFE
ncbi:formyltetrahydrofolate deformylase [Compostibacter hankyongensis]|uniref:Formyltetrahydrofolate deformylase n=1 Tax=Compostibacter hankyongensis TaxID=1007089 RepID=A0ABP8FV18_9BACT